MVMTDQHRAQAFAEQSAERYREIAEDGPVVFSVLEIDPDAELDPSRRYRLRYISPQIQDILGYPSARFYAEVWNWVSIVHPDDLATAEETSRRQIDGHPWDVDYRMIADDGRIVWMHLEGRTVERDDEGNPRRLQGIMMDVTARKEREVRLNEEATQLRSLIQSMPVVPWTYAIDDPADWRPMYIAPQVEQLLGYTAEELIAEPRFFQRLVHPVDLERILALAARSIRRGEPWLAEFRIVTRDGRLLWLRSRGNPDTDDQGRPVLHGIWVDITGERERAGAAIPGPNERREG
jgi:PAS domain S-box-containing protein